MKELINQVIIIYTCFLILLSYFENLYIKKIDQKYSMIMLKTGLGGKEVAEKILKSYKMGFVSIQKDIFGSVNGFNLYKNSIILSDAYYGTSIKDAATAGHECGHAIQHEKSSILRGIEYIFCIINSVSKIYFLILSIIGIFLYIINKQIILDLFFKQLPVICFLFFILYIRSLFMLFDELGASNKGFSSLLSCSIINDNECGYIQEYLFAAWITYLCSFTVAFIRMCLFFILYKFW